ncbi:MAG: TfoX/Sxy family protein [Proteobacteria bacterium]|nr:TfoX/Sxy family protein [Pseudomonadota bacterium]
MEDLEERIARRLAGLDPERKKMFGGTCFMIRGHMALGVSKRGMLVRTGPEGDDRAAASGAARPMEMRGRPLTGYWFVDPAQLADEAALEEWVGMALGHNLALGEKQAAKARPKRKSQ